MIEGTVATVFACPKCRRNTVVRILTTGKLYCTSCRWSERTTNKPRKR